MNSRIVKRKDGEDRDELARREFGEDVFIPFDSRDRPAARTIGYIEDPDGAVYVVCKDDDED